MLLPAAVLRPAVLAALSHLLPVVLFLARPGLLRTAHCRSWRLLIGRPPDPSITRKAPGPVPQLRTGSATTRSRFYLGAAFASHFCSAELGRKYSGSRVQRSSRSPRE